MNIKSAESMKASLETFLTEFNNKLHSDEELDAVAKVIIDSLDEIYKQTGVKFCPKCGGRMNLTSIDAARGQQFSCPICKTYSFQGGINQKWNS